MACPPSTGSSIIEAARRAYELAGVGPQDAQVVDLLSLRAKPEPASV
jgi:hypothetical protein